MAKVKASSVGTLIGEVDGYKFYEDQHYGDEMPLIVIFPNGAILRYDGYELPSSDELADWIDFYHSA